MNLIKYGLILPRVLAIASRSRIGLAVIKDNRGLYLRLLVSVLLLAFRVLDAVIQLYFKHT